MGHRFSSYLCFGWIACHDGPGLRANSAVCEGHAKCQGAHCNHDDGNDVQVMIRNTLVKDDANNRRGTNRADVRKGPEQTRRGTDLAGFDLGVEGGLVPYGHGT